MKIAHLFAAALMVAGIGVSAEASAQRYDGGASIQDVRYDRGDRHDNRRFDRRDDRRFDRGDNRRWSRHDNRRGWNNRRNNCRVVYRHHRRVTVCR